MDTLKNIMLDRYTLTLKHEYEIFEDKQISRIKADDPICVTFATEHIGKGIPPTFINEMMDRIKYELLKRMTEDNE